MAVDSTTRELIADCLVRLAKGDACAPMDLASVFMSYVDAKDIDLNLAVVEALAVIAKRQGCPEANAFLDGQWADMKKILQTRWGRAGFVR